MNIVSEVENFVEMNPELCELKRMSFQTENPQDYLEIVKMTERVKNDDETYRREKTATTWTDEMPKYIEEFIEEGVRHAHALMSHALILLGKELSAQMKDDMHEEYQRESTTHQGRQPRSYCATKLRGEAVAHVVKEQTRHFRVKRHGRRFCNSDLISTTERRSKDELSYQSGRSAR